MMPKPSSIFPNNNNIPHHHHQGLHQHMLTEYSSIQLNSASSSSSFSSSTLVYYLSILKEKLSQVQTLVGVLASPEQNLPESTTTTSSTTSMVISTMNSTIQDIIVAATSMRSSLTTFQQNIPQGTTTTTTSNQELHQQLQQSHQLLNFTSNNNNRVVSQSNFYSSTTTTEAEELDWFSESYNNSSTNNIGAIVNDELLVRGEQGNDDHDHDHDGDDIIELDAADLLARYTHFCQVCGKGFKRDANLRMHMRAHGDEYKTNAALKNNNKKTLLFSSVGVRPNNNSKKYSCPQEGCRWNKRHERFQPLKSMVCVKNHYKRSHCPKMYVCKRCNQKQFSVLSDLRTHEKHCGDPKWQCSCGTTFSRKDKLLGHVALFLGHAPVGMLSQSGTLSSEEQQQQQQQQQIHVGSR